MAGAQSAERWARHYKWLFGLALSGLGAVALLLYEHQQTQIDKLEAVVAAHMTEHKEHVKEYNALRDVVLRLELQRWQFPRQKPDPFFGGGRND